MLSLGNLKFEIEIYQKVGKRFEKGYFCFILTPLFFVNITLLMSFDLYFSYLMTNDLIRHDLHHVLYLGQILLCTFTVFQLWLSFSMKLITHYNY